MEDYEHVIKLWVGGKFIKDKHIGWRYANGKLHKHTAILDYFNELDLNDMYKASGGVGAVVSYKYLVPGYNLELGLRPIDSGLSIIKMQEHHKEHKNIIVFTEVISGPEDEPTDFSQETNTGPSQVDDPTMPTVDEMLDLQCMNEDTNTEAENHEDGDAEPDSEEDQFYEFAESAMNEEAVEDAVISQLEEVISQIENNASDRKGKKKVFEEGGSSHNHDDIKGKGIQTEPDPEDDPDNDDSDYEEESDDDSYEAPSDAYEDVEDSSEDEIFDARDRSTEARKRSLFSCCLRCQPKEAEEELFKFLEVLQQLDKIQLHHLCHLQWIFLHGLLFQLNQLQM